MNDENFKRLLEITTEYMIKNNIQTLSLKESAGQPDSCWGQITKTLHKHFCRLKSLQIFTMWKRNDRCYVDKVKTILKKINEEIKKKGIL
jgi:hypothetical protein